MYFRIRAMRNLGRVKRWQMLQCREDVDGFGERGRDLNGGSRWLTRERVFVSKRFLAGREREEAYMGSRSYSAFCGIVIHQTVVGVVRYCKLEYLNAHGNSIRTETLNSTAAFKSEEGIVSSI